MRLKTLVTVLACIASISAPMIANAHQREGDPMARTARTEVIPPVNGSLLDGNGRTARLARWLRELPKRTQVDVLVLEVKSDDGWNRVQCWDRKEVGQHLALAIDAAVTDLANEVGAFVTAKVAWWDSAAGTYWTEHALRAQPEGMQGQQAFSGDAQSAAIQTQRGLERVMSAYMGGIETSQAMLRDSASIAQENFRASQTELMLLREKVAQLELENGQLAAQLEEALSAAERIEEKSESQTNSQQQQAMQLFQGVISSMATKAS
jgi:hypothetical protein